MRVGMGRVVLVFWVGRMVWRYHRGRGLWWAKKVVLGRLMMGLKGWMWRDFNLKGRLGGGRNSK